MKKILLFVTVLSFFCMISCEISDSDDTTSTTSLVGVWKGVVNNFVTFWHFEKDNSGYLLEQDGDYAEFEYFYNSSTGKLTVIFYNEVCEYSLIWENSNKIYMLDPDENIECLTRQISNSSSKAKISITSVTASNITLASPSNPSSTLCHIGVKVTGITLEEVDAIWCRVEENRNISASKIASGYLYNSLSGIINFTDYLDEEKIYYVQAFVRMEDGAVSKSEVRSFKCSK